MKEGTSSWTEAQVGMCLEHGDIVKSCGNSCAEITFSDGSTIELQAGTEVEVVSLDISTDTSSATIRVKQTIGCIIFRVTKIIDPASRYEVETPAGVVVVRGSAVQITVGGHGTTWVCNLEGDIWAIAQGVELQIPEGECCVIRPGQPPELISVNAPPLAEDDAAITDEDNPVSVAAPGILNNDSDPDVGDTLTVISVNRSGTIGEVTAWSASGSFTYDPSGQFQYLSAGSSTTDSFTYTVSDGNGGTDTATVIITINGVNDAPTGIGLDNNSIAENQPANTVVGNLNTADPDTGNNFTYALVPGEGDTNNDSFQVVGSSLRSLVSFNHETRIFYSIRVRSTDQGGFWVEKQFTITVSNVPETHIVMASSNSPVCEETTMRFYGSPDGMTTYSWTGPSGWTSSLQNPTRPNATLAMAGNYTLTVTDGGWVSTPVFLGVTVNAKPTLTAWSNSPVSQNDTIVLVTIPSTLPTYSWTGPGGWTSSAGNTTRPNATPAMAGTYTVTVTDSHGCTDVATIDIVVN